MKDSTLFTKSKAFALRIVRLYKYLREHKESVIAKQMLRAGTSIGANIAESRYAQTSAAFASASRTALETFSGKIHKQPRPNTEPGLQGALRGLGTHLKKCPRGQFSL